MSRTCAIFFIVLPAVAFTNKGISSDQNVSSQRSNVTIARADSNRTANDGARFARDLPVPWVADMFYQALANFTIQENVGSTACQKQTQLYIRHLRNNSFWAVKMSDSWSRYPNGLLVGTSHQIGVFNECVNVHELVQGMYCITSIRIGAADGVAFELSNRDKAESLDHAWNEILGFIDYQDRLPRNDVKISICIPASCTAEDLRISLQNELNKVFLSHQVYPRVDVDPNYCSTDKYKYPYTIGFYISCAIMVLLFLTCCVSSGTHLVILTLNRSTGKTRNVPECVTYFSIIHNGRALIHYDKKNNLNIFNGIKVVTMNLIIFGHTFLYFAVTPLTSSEDIEDIYETGPYILLTCMNLVDPFFYISGFLMYYLLKPEIIKNGYNWIQLPKIILYKYLRILPPCKAMIILTAYVVPYLSDGPFWEAKMWPEAEKCKNNWWANIIGINNFMKVDQQCLVVGWYISCLLQLLIIGSIVTYVCVKNYKVGVSLLGVLLFLFIVLPFVLTYISRSYAIIKVTYQFFQNQSTSYEFSNLYMPFYIRGLPFVIGMLAGVALEELKRKKITISIHMVYTLTVIITFICFCIQYYGARFYQRNRPYDVVEQAIYAVFIRCNWSIMLFWITVCHFTTGYGPIERMLNNRLFVPLGRLSYSIYLVNITVIMTKENRQRTLVSPSFLIFQDIWMSSTFRIHLVGIVMYLLVEAPFSVLTKRIFVGSKNTSDKETGKEPVERKIAETPNIQTESIRL